MLLSLIAAVVWFAVGLFTLLCSFFLFYFLQNRPQIKPLIHIKIGHSYWKHLMQCISPGRSPFVYCFHIGFMFHFWAECRPQSTTDAVVMENSLWWVLTAKLSKSWQWWVDTWKTHCALKSSARTHSPVCSCSLNYAAKMKSSLLNLPCVDTNPWKMIRKRLVSRTLSQTCLVCDWCGSQRG